MPRLKRASLMTVASLLAMSGILLLSGCATTGKAAKGKKGYSQRGLASWYGPGFHGRQAANGETYDMHQMTAAHRTLPFDTIVEVHNRDNGRRVRVRINDRGPFVRGRIIDLSHEAAERIGMIGPGTARVEIRVVAEASEGARHRPFWIQAGAFRSGEDAEDTYRQLREDFPDVQLTHDGTWYRIRLGPFNKRKTAEKIERELARRGVDAFVTRQ